MKHIFIVNPVAGGNDKTEDVRKLAKEVYGDDFEIYVTSAPLDATEKVRSLGQSGEEYEIFSCGGDGTFNECCNGAAGFKNLALAPFPIGTGNDFCRMFGKESSLYTNLKALSEGSARPIDMIDCGGKYSVNLCSVGFDARVGCNVHNYTHLPLCNGPLSYVVSLIVELTKGVNSEMVIDCNGEHLEGKFALACVCNGRFYGGGFMPSKDARPDDGVLDIFVCREVSFFKLALNLGKYSSGRSDEVDCIAHFKSDAINMKFKNEMLINFDGESVYSDHLDMKLVPGIINLIVPKGMKFFEN